MSDSAESHPEPASMQKARKVDEFGNVSYEVTRGGGVIARTLKLGNGKWQVEPAPFTSYAPVGSIKAGMDWLARYAPAAQPAPDIEAGS